MKKLLKTIQTKEVHYYSRSRNSVWHKGKTSGWIQKVKFIRIDDDQDLYGSLWILVMSKLSRRLLFLLL